MGRIKGEGRITTSVTVSPEFFNLAKENNISFSEAVRIGISIILGDKGVKDYDNNLNLFRKMTLFRQQLEEVSAKYLELEKKSNGTI